MKGQTTIDGFVLKRCEGPACGREFRAMKSTARYCSGACRMVALRVRRGGRPRPRHWHSGVRPCKSGD